MLRLVSVLLCLRQGFSSDTRGGPGWAALHSELYACQGQRRIGSSDPLAGCAEPDVNHLPAWWKRQCERTAACGASFFTTRCQCYHHQTGQLQGWGLLHLHLWSLSQRLKRRTNLPYCHRWVLDKMYLLRCRMHLHDFHLTASIHALQQHWEFLIAYITFLFHAVRLCIKTVQFMVGCDKSSWVIMEESHNWFLKNADSLKNESVSVF